MPIRLAVRPLTTIGVLFAALSLPLSVVAQTWNGALTGTTSTWNTPSNWSPATVPNAVGAAASFPNSPTATMTVPLGAAITVGSINVANSGTTQVFTISNGTGGSLTFDVASGNAAFTMGGTNPTTNNVTVSATTILNDTLDFTNNDTSGTGAATGTFTGAMTGNGGFIKDGPGKLSMSTVVKAYAGPTTINQGRMRFTTSGQLTGTSSILVNNSGQLYLDQSAGVWSFGAPGAVITINGTGDAGVSGAITSQGGGANTLANPVALGSAATIDVTGGGSLQLNGIVSGGSNLTVTSGTTGTVILANTANSYSGGTTITSGAVQFSKALAMPSSGLITNNATLSVNAGGSGEWTNGTSGGGSIGGLIAGTGGQGTANQINWVPNKNFGIDTTNATGGTFTYSGVVGSFHTATGTTDAITLTKLGTNTLVLGSANTLTGGVTLVAGTLGIGDNNAIGSGKLTLNGSGNLDPAGANRTVANPIDMNTGPVFNDATNQFTFTGPVNIINAATGQTVGRTINMNVAGTVTFGASPGSSTITIGNPTSNGGDNVGKTLIVSASPSGTIVLHDVLQDPTTGGGTASATVNMSGQGTIQVDAQNTYSGGSTLSGSLTTLVIGSSSSTGTSGPLGTGTLIVGSTASTAPRIQASGAQTVSNNITLTNTGVGTGNSGVRIQGPDNLTLSGVITGGSTTGITKVDGGTLTLTNVNNTYSGATNITGGTLLANNVSGSGTGSGNITVGNGTANSGTFGGTGAVTGNVTVNNGGTLSPGAASISKFAIGGLTLNSGSTFAYELNSSASPTPAGDLLNANGGLTIAASGAKLTISDASNTPLTPGTKYTLISYSGTWNGNTFDTYADDSTITVGANQFLLNYNDTVHGDNFDGGSFTKFVTLTAVPEANAFWLGGAVCSVLGLVAGTRKLRGRHAAG